MGLLDLPTQPSGGYRPTGDTNNEQEDGHHITLVPVVLHIQSKLLHQACVLVCKEALAEGRSLVTTARFHLAETRVESAWIKAQFAKLIRISW